MMDQVSPTSPPPTPPSGTAHLFSKTNTFIKASAKRIGKRNGSDPQILSQKSISDLSELLSGVLQPPESLTGDARTARSRATSTSTPSLVLSHDENQSPRKLKSRPSFPTLKLPTNRPNKSQSNSSPYTNSLTNTWTLTPSETSAPPVPQADLGKSDLSPEEAAEMEPQPRNVDISDAIERYGAGAGNLGRYGPAGPGGMQTPAAVYQHIQEMSAKRVSTLEYLKKAHYGQVYWFNSLLFSRADLMRLPSFEARRLARRATNYLLLGLSIPNILDVNASSPMDYLRALNALLTEFETYQSIHPADGSASSSLSRAKLPQMFKRSTYSASTKGRRSSSAADIGLPMGSSDPSDLKSMTSGIASANSSTITFGASEQELLPGEEYNHLLTPSLPFDPDFFETFVTLCDILIDTYTRIMQLISSPAVCGGGVGETFAKADARLRKVIVSGIIKEFEDASRAGIKNEIAGIGKVVLGGLI